MIVLPYFYCNRQLGIFLSKGGETLWTIDDDADYMATLADNGFPVVSISKCTNDILYVKIDYYMLKINDFYLSTDYDISTKDVWKIFDLPEVILTTRRFHRILRTLTNERI